MLTGKSALDNEGVDYRVSPYRWLILFVVAIAQMMAYTIFVTLQPIAIPLAEAFNLSSVFLVNLTVILETFTTIPMTFFCVWMYSRYSTTLVLRMATTILLIGALLRALC